MDYSQIVAEGDLEELKKVAAFIVNSLPCKIVREPLPGMVMIKYVDPLEKTPFYLGEAYVTQCEVKLDGNLGYGCVLGTEEERSLIGAILDAVLGNKHLLADQVLSQLEPIKAGIIAGWADQERMTARTKVDFDVKKG